MFGGTVACALGIGFVMQRGNEVPTSLTALDPVPIQKSVLGSAPQTPQAIPTPVAPELTDVSQAGQDALQLDSITLTSAQPAIVAPRALPPLEKKAAYNRDSANVPNTPADPKMPQLGCAVVAQARAGDTAIAHLDISAPCYGNERLTVHHNGMMFTATTDASGKLTVDVPALAEKAVFIVAFSNGKGAVAQAQIPDLAQFDRIVLQWPGDDGFQIHAREFGASYGESGHVWSGRSDTQAKQATGGFVTRLGDAATLAPQMAEVYTFPTRSTKQSGTVTLSIEAEVTEANCGSDVSAQTLELHAGDKLRTRDLVLSVPACSAIGDFLVLNNLVNDLKIAGN